MNYRKLCRQVLALDKSVTFAGIAITQGKIIAAEYRDYTTSLLTKEESELSIMQSLIRMNMRKALEHKLGKTLFSITEYENLRRATIMFSDSENKFGLGNEFLLLVSFDKSTTDPYKIVTDKVLPFLRQKQAEKASIS